jgi:hypothetical protein
MKYFLNRKDRKAIFNSSSTMHESFSVNTGSESPFFVPFAVQSIPQELKNHRKSVDVGFGIQ